MKPVRLLCPLGSPGKNTELPFPPAGDLPNPGIKPASLWSPELAGGFFTTSKGKPREILGNPGLCSAVCQLYLNTTGRKNLSK